jgi:HK97 family phage prohead protease
MSGLQYRVAPEGSVRDMDDTKRQALVSFPWEVLDTYKTDFERSAFDAELAVRLPTACWQHIRSEPIGRAIEHQKTSKANELRVQFSDFDAVPRARQAFTQMRDGDIEDWSYGFDKAKSIKHPDGDPTHNRFMQARMAEISPVTVGSIPGATTLGVRSDPGLSLAGVDVAGLRALRDDGTITDEELKQILGLGGEGLVIPEHRDPEELAQLVRQALDAVDGAGPDEVEVALAEAGLLADELLESMGVQRAAAPPPPYGNVEYADPGYQADKKKRYPLDTKARVIAALSYIGQAKNAGQYSADDLAKVKAKIEAAAKKMKIGDRADEPEEPTPVVPELAQRAASVFSRDLGGRFFE